MVELPNVPVSALTVLKFAVRELLLPPTIISVATILANVLVVVSPLVVASAIAARLAYRLGT
jgi:uncharacterized membrane protein (DUF2068 family)